MTHTLDSLSPLMALRPTKDGFEADTFATAHGSIFGAYLLLQQVIAAERTVPDKRVLSLQTIFANGGQSGEPVQISVETMQQGRSFSCLSLTFRQGNVIVTRAEVLLTVDEDDYLRHQSPEPQPFGGHEWPTRAPGLWPGQVRRSPASDEHSVALRFDLDEPVTDATVGRALVALSTEPEVLSALLLQSDVPSAPAGRMPANVLTQTVTFVEPIDLSTGFGLTLTPTYAGHGRAHGSGQVVTESGRLLATFSTTGLLRAPRQS